MKLLYGVICYPKANLEDPIESFGLIHVAYEVGERHRSIIPADVYPNSRAKGMCSFVPKVK